MERFTVLYLAEGEVYVTGVEAKSLRGAHNKVRAVWGASLVAVLRTKDNGPMGAYMLGQGANMPEVEC